jgi:hypothetical protein
VPEIGKSNTGGVLSFNWRDARLKTLRFWGNYKNVSLTFCPNCFPGKVLKTGCLTWFRSHAADTTEPMKSNALV